MVTAPSPRSLSTEAAQSLYDYRLEAAETARQLHWDCTISVQSQHSLRTDLPRLAPGARTRNRTMLVDNVNTYAVARSHLRCQKKRTENRRQIYCTAPGANVNEALVKFMNLVHGGIILKTTQTQLPW